MTHASIVPDGDPTVGGCAVMLVVPAQAGWSAVANEALAAGFQVPAGALHLTVAFLGRDLSVSKVEKIPSVLEAILEELGQEWRTMAKPEHLEKEGTSFVPLYFTGQIGYLDTRRSTNVAAFALASAGLLNFRQLLTRHMPVKVRDDFGGYNPHVTLGSTERIGARLPRPMQGPATKFNARLIELKLGQTRRLVDFR